MDPHRAPHPVTDVRTELKCRVEVCGHTIGTTSMARNGFIYHSGANERDQYKSCQTTRSLLEATDRESAINQKGGWISIMFTLLKETKEWDCFIH